MLISVHLPKTAGESFYLSLESVYGPNILRDYGDGPMQKSRVDRNREALQAAIDNIDANLSGVECIHGHFMPVKFLLLASCKDLKFVTWLRNPVDRMVSHYFYWKKNYDQHSAGALQRKMIGENWTLERFIFCDELQNFYAQYLWGFPLERFDFIGITERYNEDFAYFSEKVMGCKLPTYRVNVGSREGFKLSASLRRKAEKYHSDDMEIYYNILKSRSVWQGGYVFFKKKLM